MQSSDSKVLRTFTKNVKTIMKLHGWTQSVLADRLGIGVPTVSKYLNGRITPSIAVADEYAKALGVPLSRLLSNK